MSFATRGQAKLLTCDEYLNKPVVQEDQIHSKKCTFSYIEFEALDEVNISLAEVTEIDYENDEIDVDVSKTIEIVEFVSCRFPLLPKELFTRFRNLRIVSCDGVNLNILSKADFKMALNLESFSSNTNYVKSLEKMLFNGSKKLQSLDLSINEIEDIDRTAFFGLENLRKLLLSDNKLRNLSEDVFEDLISLEEINLSSNQITVVDGKLFENCKLLNYIYLNYNQIQQISEKSFATIKEIKFLELSNNELSSLRLNISASALYANNNQLKSIDLNSVGYLSFFKNSIEKVYLEHKEGVLSLNISTNNLNPDSLLSILDLSEIKSLDLSFNNLGALNVSTFLNMPKLQILNLQSTNLSKIGYGLYTHQSSLEQLDLSYNNLGGLDLMKLAPLKALTTLFIEGNKINEIEFEKIKTLFPALKLFGLSDNAWSCSYLSTLISFLNQNEIEVYHLMMEKTKPNVEGITCTESGKANERVSYEDRSLSVNPIRHHELLLSDSNELQAISEKFEVILRHVNETKEKFVTKVELINELNMIKSVVTSLKQDMEEIRKQHDKLSDSEKSVVNDTVMVLMHQKPDYDEKVNGLSGRVVSIEQSVNEMKIQLKSLSESNTTLYGAKYPFSKFQSATTNTCDDNFVTKLMITVVFLIVCGFAIIYVIKSSRKARKFIVRRTHLENEGINVNVL